jgi:general secretion pathway protein J
LEKETDMAVAGKGRAGFTLVETLAGLAIASMIILSTGTLIHQGAFFFDRGTRAVDENEQLALAIECLTRDFAAVRFLVQKTTNGTGVGFIGEPTSAEEGGRIVFVTAGGREAGPQGEGVVSISVEASDDVTQLVRRRAPWYGHMRLEDAQPGDAAVLLKGKFSVSFSFSKLAQDGNATWSDHWTDEKGLPHSVRMILRDEATGASLVDAIFAIHADAPPVCVTGKANCFSLAAKTAADAPATLANSPANQTR